MKEFKKASESGEGANLQDLYSYEQKQNEVDKDQVRLQREINWYIKSGNEKKVEQIKQKLARIEEKNLRSNESNTQSTMIEDTQSESDMELYKKIARVNPYFMLKTRERPIMPNLPID